MLQVQVRWGNGQPELLGLDNTNVLDGTCRPYSFTHARLEYMCSRDLPLLPTPLLDRQTALYPVQGRPTTCCPDLEFRGKR